MALKVQLWRHLFHMLDMKTPNEPRTRRFVFPDNLGRSSGSHVVIDINVFDGNHCICPPRETEGRLRGVVNWRCVLAVCQMHEST